MKPKLPSLHYFRKRSTPYEDGGRQLVRCIAVNTDGSRVASGHEDGILRIWKLDNTATESLYKSENH